MIHDFPSSLCHNNHLPPSIHGRNTTIITRRQHRFRRRKRNAKTTITHNVSMTTRNEMASPLTGIWIKPTDTGSSKQDPVKLAAVTRNQTEFQYTPPLPLVDLYKPQKPSVPGRVHDARARHARCSVAGCGPEGPRHHAILLRTMSVHPAALFAMQNVPAWLGSAQHCLQAISRSRIRGTTPAGAVLPVQCSHPHVPGTRALQAKATTLSRRSLHSSCQTLLFSCAMLSL